MNELARRTLERAAAAASVPVMEDPPGSNRGPAVEYYQRRVGIHPGDPWCAAAATTWVADAARDLGVKHELPLTGSSSALYRWAKKTGNLLAHPEAGCIGLVRGGKTGFEHTFVVSEVDPTERMTRSYDGNWGSRVRSGVEHLIRTSVYLRIV